MEKHEFAPDGWVHKCHVTLLECRKLECCKVNEDTQRLGVKFQILARPNTFTA